MAHPVRAGLTAPHVYLDTASVSLAPATPAAVASGPSSQIRTAPLSQPRSGVPGRAYGHYEQPRRELVSGGMPALNAGMAVFLCAAAYAARR
jgi:hypothetical protein